MKHTPEPWNLHNEKIEVEGIMYGIGGGKCDNGKPYFLAGVCQLGDDGTDDAIEGMSNADRIVTCINACAGMKEPAKEIATLKQQRDQFLDELQTIAFKLAITRNGIIDCIDKRELSVGCSDIFRQVMGMVDKIKATL